MEYLTLALRLRMNESNQLTITAQGPNGEWAENCVDNPFENKMLKELMMYFNRLVAEEKDISDVGEILGSILFSGPVLQLFHLVKQHVFSLPNRGLRIRLHFPTDETYVFLGTWPWETLSIDHQVLVMNPRITMVRTFDLAQPFASPTSHKQFDRILLVSANPNNLPQLNIDKEVESIKKEMQDRVNDGKLIIDTINNPSFAQLETKLRNSEYDILHFTGHISGRNENESWLALVDADGLLQKVNPQKLASALIGTGIRMVTINAGDKGASIAFLGALIMIGIPVVVGHNNLLPEAIAIEFSTTFYAKLSDKNSLDQAIFSARRMMAQGEDQNFWSSPILYSRIFSGEFWASESDFVIESIIENGKLVTRTKRRDEVDVTFFDNSLQSITDYLAKIEDEKTQFEINNHINTVKDNIASGNFDLASREITEAQTKILNAVEAQKRQAEKVRQERSQRWAAFALTVVAFGAVGIFAGFFGDRWSPNSAIPIIGLPVSVIVWSFLGGIAAMQQAFIGTRRNFNQEHVNYEWLLWRPIIGMVMGSVIYLVINAGLVSLDQGGLNQANTQTYYFVWALAFLGGFSDRFTILIFDNVVRAFSGSERDEKGSSNAQSATPADDANQQTS